MGKNYMIRIIPQFVVTVSDHKCKNLSFSHLGSKTAKKKIKQKTKYNSLIKATFTQKDKNGNLKKKYFDGNLIYTSKNSPLKPNGFPHNYNSSSGKNISEISSLNEKKFFISNKRSLRHENGKFQDPHIVKTLKKEPYYNDHISNNDFFVSLEIPKHSWLTRSMPPAPNRFNIMPGHHWDGVNRTT